MTSQPTSTQATRPIPVPTGTVAGEGQWTRAEAAHCGGPSGRVRACAGNHPSRAAKTVSTSAVNSGLAHPRAAPGGGAGRLANSATIWPGAATARSRGPTAQPPRFTEWVTRIVVVPRAYPQAGQVLGPVAGGSARRRRRKASRSGSRGSSASARRMRRRWRMPPDQFGGAVRQKPSRPTERDATGRWRARSAGRRATTSASSMLPRTPAPGQPATGPGTQTDQPGPAQGFGRRLARRSSMLPPVGRLKPGDQCQQMSTCRSPRPDKRGGHDLPEPDVRGPDASVQSRHGLASARRQGDAGRAVGIRRHWTLFEDGAVPQVGRHRPVERSARVSILDATVSSLHPAKAVGIG